MLRPFARGLTSLPSRKLSSKMVWPISRLGFRAKTDFFFLEDTSQN